jgi:hypothetical protein
MARFQADFSSYPAVIYAPAKVEFTNNSTVGRAIADEYTTAVDSEGNIVDLEDIAIDSITVAAIEKTEWEFGDEQLSVEDSPEHVFNYSNLYEIKLSIYSEEFYHEGLNIFYRLRNSITKTLDVGLMSVAWLRQHMTEPHIEAFETSLGWKDLMTATGRMFDRIYEDIGEALKIIDIRQAAPRFLQFFSETLGHKRFYAQKIGYREQEDNALSDDFLDYDIFDRITNDQAGDAEIELFRKFIEDTARLFKKNGSEEALEDFLKLYGFIIDLKPMWTTNFGTQSFPPIADNFFNDPTLESTLNQFKYRGVSVTGWENENGYLDANSSNLLMDNYHYLTKHVYPIDTNSDRPTDCEIDFLINDFAPNILRVVRDDGRKIAEKLPCSNFFAPTACLDDQFFSCTEDGVRFEKNNSWDGTNRIVNGVNTKFWRVTDNYVTSVINVLGIIPRSPDEADELPYDTTDDYLWANWKSGIEATPGVPGVDQSILRRPGWQTVLPNLNLANAFGDTDLIEGEDVPIDTSRDLFVVSRGFIKVETAGYYSFSVLNGNGSTDLARNHVSLLSLKHGTSYTEDELKEFLSMDEVTFQRDQGEVSYTVQNGTSTRTIYGRRGEYGIVELHQDEVEDEHFISFSQENGFYNLTPGYYAFELKSTYNTHGNKKLRLFWEMWDEVIRPTGTFFERIMGRQVIPAAFLSTIDDGTLTIADQEGKGIMTIPYNLLEGGDSYKTVYVQNDPNGGISSGFISSDKKFKNSEILVRLSPQPSSELEDTINLKAPQRRFGIVFRGTNQNKDLYANVDTYYAFMFDGIHGEYGLAQVSYNPEIDLTYFRYFNLNPDQTDLDQQVFFQSITDEYEHQVPLEEGIYYDFRVVIEDDKVNVYYREASEFTTAVVSVQKSLSIDLTEYDSSVDEWQQLLTDISLDVDDAQTQTFDIDSNLLDISERYTYVDDVGDYGLFIIDSSFSINKFVVCPLDKVDYSRVETEDKWKTLKPKYLDSRNYDELQYNSYEATGVERRISPTFKFPVTDDYNNESRFVLPSYLGKVTDNDVNRLYVDNMDGTNFGSRFNILIDQDYLADKFKSTEEVLDTLCVPVGRFFEPYLDWSIVEEDDEQERPYQKIPHGGYTRYVSENAHIMPHTMAASANDGKTLTDFVSEFERDDDDVSLLTLDGYLNTYLKATSEGNYLGIWEEVSPESSSEEFEVTGLGSVLNPLFNIIKKGDDAVGVQVKSDTAYRDLQCRYCEDGIIWGLYDISLPLHAVNLLEPFLQTLKLLELDELTTLQLNALKLICVSVQEPQPRPYEDQCDTSRLYVETIRYFIPIGKLDGENFTFLPPAELLKSDNVRFELLGVYSHLTMGSVLLQDNDDNIQFSLTDLNPYEEAYKSRVQCNYYLDVEVPLVSKITKYNNVVVRKSDPTSCDPGSFLYRNPDDKPDEEGCSDYIANAFFMPDSIIKIYEFLEEKYPVEENNVIDPTFTEYFDWWTPDDLWFKRRFDVVYEANSDNSLFGGFTDVGSSFYGETINDAGTLIALQDNYFATPGDQLMEVEWCVNTVGWDTDYYSINGISQSELTSLSQKMKAPMPLETVQVSGQEFLTIGGYYNDELYGKRTLSPVGLFNWYQTHSDGISGSERIGWEVSDWNEEFFKCFAVKNVYSPIETDVYEINKYWGFFNEEIPPQGTTVGIEIENRNCFEVDGENAPETSQRNITLGVSDGIIGFYAVPPILFDYIEWRRQLQRVDMDRYTIPSDHYTISQNTETQEIRSQLNLRTDQFNFNKYVGAEMVLNFFYDKLFPNVEDTLLRDDFNNHREITWITCIDNEKYYTVAQRAVDSELKYTGGSLPYNIVEYRNNNVYQLMDKFSADSLDTVSGNEEIQKRKENIVGFERNRGIRPVMSLIDTESNNYTISCDVIFDQDIFNTDYQKRFELIVKAENNFLIEEGQWGITDFYYVGIGTNDFDIGLSMRALDQKTGEVQETFLASFGDFNLRNIKPDVWYTLKAEVVEDSIKIFFNEKQDNEALVLNYNINKKYEKLTERYLKGEFETLQAIIIGLEDLGITYPDTLGQKVSDDYKFDNFVEEFAGTLPINGLFTGFRVFNPMTYVTNIRYAVRTPKKYKFGSAYDGFSFNDLLYKIEKRYGFPEDAEIRKFDASLDGTVFVQINDRLYYQSIGNDPERYRHKIDTFEIVEDKVVVVEKFAPSDSAVGLNTWEPGQHSFTWSLVSGTNIHSSHTYADLLQTIPNGARMKVVRTFDSGLTSTREIVTVGTSGISGKNGVLSVGDAITVTVSGDRTINWPLDGELAIFDIFVRVFQDAFETEYPILIKDRTFYNDGLQKYLDIADKSIKDVHINDNMLHLIFEDN